MIMVEESNELKKVDTALSPATQIPNQEVAKYDSSKSREEGELSSSDDDVCNFDYP